MTNAVFCNHRRSAPGLLLLLFLLLINACGSNEKQALAYNDALVEEQQKIIEKFDAFFEALSRPEDTLAINATHAAVKQQVALGQKNVQQMPDFDGKAEVRDATLELFKVYEEVLNNEFQTLATNYKKPAGSYTADVKVLTDKAYDDGLQKMSQALTQLENVQRDFVKAYDLNLEADTLIR